MYFSSFGKKLPLHLLLCHRCANFASMQVSVELLKEWFTGFNVRYFDGSLPVPAFAVGHSRTRLGSLTWRYKYKLFFRRPCSYVIRVSNYYDLDELQFKSVLLHEMIHLHIVSRRLKDSSPHGVLFRKIMNEINADGWNVSVSANMRGVSRSRCAAGRRKRIVLAACMADGRHLLSVVSPRHVMTVDHVVRRSSGVKSYSWHVSADEYFADFPVVRTPKGRIVSADTYSRMLSSMSPADPDKLSSLAGV